MKKSIISMAVAMAVSGVVVAEEDGPTFESNKALMDIQNRCIVRLQDGVPGREVPGLARALAAQGGGAEIHHVYRHAIKGFTVGMPCHAAANAFGADPDVMWLEPDGVVSISKGKPGDGGGGGGQQVSYGTPRVGGPVFQSGNTAWVIDSGVDLDHPDLNVNAARGFSAITSKGAPSMDDENGHGTHVAGTIGALDNNIGSLGVAPGTEIVPVRVLDRRGSGSYSGVIAGVDHVAANGSAGDCANMSLGGGASDSLDAAVTNAAKGGVLFVLAAGNDGDDANNHSPARANGPNVYTISATDSNDRMASWSNYGNPPVDYAAPGVGIFSLWKNGGTNTISGTSMAAPHACAVVMLRNGNPSSDGTASNDPDGNPDPIIHY